MEQHVAELVAHRSDRRLDRVIELEGFLDQIGTECLRVCARPRTPLAQLAHESQSTSKR